MNVKIDNLKKYYDYHCILHIENLEIKSGSFYGIIGPNGAGKSTLVKILAGLLPSSEGSIVYDNKNLDFSIQRKMTMVFQKPYLLRTTVFNNIAYPLSIRGFDHKTIYHRVNNMLKNLGIENIKDQKAWTLSGGEAQKVALARALAFKPSFLILDEPTASLDPESLLVIESTLQNFYEDNPCTILMVTHNLSQAQRLCEQLIFLNKGGMEAIGSTTSLLLNPTTENLKSFIHSHSL